MKVGGNCLIRLAFTSYPIVVVGTAQWSFAKAFMSNEYIPQWSFRLISLDNETIPHRAMKLTS